MLFNYLKIDKRVANRQVEVFRSRITGSRLKLNLQGKNLMLTEKKNEAFLDQICSTRISTYKV